MSSGGRFRKMWFSMSDFLSWLIGSFAAGVVFFVYDVWRR